ncbi:MAG: hypothetical protein ABIS09_08205 [Sphingomicrobium sp.]
MIKTSNSTKKSVELSEAPRPSRIRREPVTAAEPPKGLAAKISRHSSEWEITLGIIGIVLFALAINAILFGVSATLIN